ncbi:universal stress protein [Modestobacter versicolor]|uniref:universal stress protein n=1 Tax=Modestobacter versicolor TaxID=429133 RepID=UPI0034DF038C
MPAALTRRRTTDVTVLVGFVPTSEGCAAFAAWPEEARRRGEDLLVLDTPRGGAAVSADVAPPELVEDMTGRARGAGVEPDVRQTPHCGDLADAVPTAAEDATPSVIAIGLRKRSPVGGLLMGSTARRILLDADRPVLAVQA